ncbi:MULTISPECIES: NIPSNAP family protein [unclassified Bradyrhizobium]|uniref:NIPSNAP family protein n=1 Tax=unclassified Bradyrhizobium TaxID=2631580 RepID=UPI0028E8B8FB|nr:MULTISPECIES: NIPSNAP family protein [unclassified Bradyrhizobium]
MKTYEIRTYTLKSAEAATAYREIWTKHIESLKAFGIVTHGVFTVASDPAKVVALVNYPEGVDPKVATDRYMASEMFKADMAGFDFAWFCSVEATLLIPETFSPLQ